MLKIYIGWNGEVDRPSYYYPSENIIYVNPVFYDFYPHWMWFIPLIHEVGHWIINKLPCTKPTVVGLAAIHIFHLKLDILHVWLIKKLFG